MTRLLVLVALASLATSTAHADGMRIEDGRYAGGAVTTLTLEPEQLVHWPEERWVQLTPAQRSALKASTGIAPSAVYVYDARKNESDCTCHAWNVAFLFAPDGMDVPHRFVVDDAEAARRQAELDSME